MLGIKQNRPLLLAGLDKLNPKEMAKLLTMSISWSVRLLIGGIQGSSPVETAYGNAAQQVNNRKFKTAADVAEHMLRVVPKDERFELDFAEASVTQAALARYYLATLEKCLKGKKDLYYSGDEDITVNLEHIMPETRVAAWQHIPEEDYDLYTNRIGNLALMDANDNSAIGSESWSVKKPILKSSAFQLTKEAAKLANWGFREVSSRQERLAQVAIKAWPLKGK